MGSQEWLRTLLNVSAQRRKQDEEECRVPPLKIYNALSFAQGDAAVALIVRIVDHSGELKDQHFNNGAAILESMNDDCEMELLYMKRTANENDPWSGHVAFPGGRQDSDESLFDTARRETKEEVGLHLDEPYYEYVTYLTPESITRMQRKSGASVYPFVFLQLWIPGEKKTPDPFCVEADPSEVAAAIWVPLKHFRLPPDRDVVRRSAEYLPGLRQLPRLFRVILGVREACFPSIRFPHSGRTQQDGTLEFVHRVGMDGKPLSSFRSGEPAFNLWGISLAITDDLCRLLGVLSCRSLNWPPMVFNSGALLPNGILRTCYGFTEIRKYPRIQIHPSNVFHALGFCGVVVGLVSLPLLRKYVTQRREL